MLPPLRAPPLLLVAAELAAKAEGISVGEWWRRAARVRLGWHEVVPPPTALDVDASGARVALSPLRKKR